MNRTYSLGNIINKRKKISGITNHLVDILGQWSTIEVGDSMNKDIKRCIDLILMENDCKEVIYLFNNEESKLWIILEEDDFDSNMRISDKIEGYLEFKSIDLDYCFFDEDEIEEIKDQLSIMNLSTRRFHKNG